jgi:hypothetical protein
MQPESGLRCGDSGVEGLLSEERGGRNSRSGDGFAYEGAGEDLGDADVDVAADGGEHSLRG